MSVAAITTDNVLRMLTPLWTTKTETASKLRRYVEAVINHATHVKKLRSGENPAGWSLLRHSLQSTKKVAPAKSFASMDPIELPSFMVELAAVDDIAARALEVLILTASRRGDIIGQQATASEAAKPPMRWADVDLDHRIWTIPKDKMGNQFQVPLSDAVITILRALPRKGERVFPMDDKHSMWKLFRTMRPDLTVHGFRSTFSAWAKNIGHRRELVEATLKHVVHQNAVEAAYSKHVTYLPGRTQLMQLWAEFATGIEAKIVHLHTA
jgi:integrase